jgi:hypothetical protein
MAIQDRRLEEPESRRTLIIVVAVGAAVVVALFFALLMWSGDRSTGDPRLAGGIRAGTAEFEPYKSQIVLDDPEAFESPRALGDIVMELKTTVRNLSNKTLDGLEVRAAVVDHQNASVGERTVRVIPDRQRELAPNTTMDLSIRREGFKPTADRANSKMEIPAGPFKE